MIYKTGELKKILGSFPRIKKALEEGKYFKVSHGLYSDKEPVVSELENIFAKYPNAVLTLESAFAYYEMSDYVPNKYVVATTQKAHKILNNKVKQIYITDSILNIGKTTIKTKYGVINVYDRERMVIELFRLKTKLPYSYFKEIVNSCRELVKEEKISISKLVKYCSMFSNGESIEKQIQEVIL